jgi:hypothetical protein
MNIAAQKQTQIITETPDRPTSPGEWSIDQIIDKLRRPLPDSITETRKQGGKQITFIPWHQVNRVLDKYAIGWTWQLTNIVTTDDRIFVTGRLTIPTTSGDVFREATGTELLKETTRDGEIREIAYGDPSSNAESMAFRRSAARFGLGLYLYDK